MVFGCNLLEREIKVHLTNILYLDQMCGMKWEKAE